MAEKVNQGIELVKAGANVLGQFYQDLAQPSVKALGQIIPKKFGQQRVIGCAGNTVHRIIRSHY